MSALLLYRSSDWRYDIDAELLDRMTADVIRPIFAEFVAQGFNPREIAHIMQAAVWDCELDTILDAGKNKQQP